MTKQSAHGLHQKLMTKIEKKLILVTFLSCLFLRCTKTAPYFFFDHLMNQWLQEKDNKSCKYKE